MHWLHTPVAIRKQHFIPPITPRFPRSGNIRGQSDDQRIFGDREILPGHSERRNEWMNIHDEQLFRREHKASRILTHTAQHFFLKINFFPVCIYVDI